MGATRILGLALVCAACTSRAPAPSSDAAPPATPSFGATNTALTVPGPATAARSECLARIEQAKLEPALPGAPGFEARRAEILARSKAEPVLFRRAPRAAEPSSKEIVSLRARLANSAAPGLVLLRVLETIGGRQELARELLLPEGYLYSEVPALAAMFVDAVDLGRLFREPRLVIQRGGQLLHAKKRVGYGYEYVDGPEQGQLARLLLLDRVWPEGHEPGPPLHVDLRAAAAEVGYERLRVQRITERHVIAEARHGSDWVPSLFSIADTDMALDCQAIPEERRVQVEAAKSLALRRQRALGPLRAAIVTMVNEALPFDEPKTEEGQQDGNLRPAWRWAYNHGWDSYTFNDDSYMVFDGKGRPKVPQVCIDFVTDTIERASGTWWAGRERDRQRIRGGVDFDELGIENRRSVDVFIRFAEQHPEWFDVYGLAEEERTRFADRAPFFAHLSEHADRYLPGDIIAIHGPRSDGENHWHSFYVYDADPVTGIPILLASNAGKPRIRSWEGEMRNAPLRSIHTRIRPRLDWLERVLGPTESLSAAAPAPLISAPI